MDIVSASQARANLPAILDRVEAGDEVVITRHDRPVAVVVRPDSLRSRRADAALSGARRVEAALQDARKRSRPERGLSAAEAEELIAVVRGGRSAR